MALVAASAPCLVCATLGPVAERNFRSIQGGQCHWLHPPQDGNSRRLAWLLVPHVKCSAALNWVLSRFKIPTSLTAPWRASLTPDRQIMKRGAAGIRCQQSSEGGAANSLDIWIGRAAMLGFVAALGVEIATGKGVLETAGITAPAPTVAWILTAIVGFVTAFGVFRSASKD